MMCTSTWHHDEFNVEHTEQAQKENCPRKNEYNDQRPRNLKNK